MLMYCDQSLMRVRGPLDSPLLDSTGILWRGVGNTDLLAPPAPDSERRIVAMGSPSTPSSRFELLELNRKCAEKPVPSPTRRIRWNARSLRCSVCNRLPFIRIVVKSPT